ncbi:MAG: TolC family protein [Deltaproteobacteria bacterium]|nr:TolC family protein [Deltaproteobacteria bacterium]
MALTGMRALHTLLFGVLSFLPKFTLAAELATEPANEPAAQSPSDSVAERSAPFRWRLSTAIEEALRRSPSARLAEARVAAAQSSLDAARAAFWPQLSVGLQYSVTNNSAMAFGSILNQEAFRPDLNFNDVSAVDDLNASATVRVPLFTGLSRFAQRDAADAGVEMARLDHQAVQRTLVFEVARAYFTVLKARAFIHAADAAVKAFDHNLEIAKQRLSQGTLLKQATLDVELRRARALEDLSRATHAEALAREGLKSVMGLEPNVVLDIESIDLGKAPDLTDTAQRERPELASSARAIDQAEAGARAAKGAYWPQIGAFASLMFDHGFIEDGHKLSYLAGVDLRWSVWDGMLTASRVAGAEAGARMAEAQAAQLRIALNLELEQARIKLREAKARVSVTEQAIDLAAESAQLTRARFEEGLAIASQIIDAETELTASQVRNAEAVADFHIALAALVRALGLPSTFYVQADD